MDDTAYRQFFTHPTQNDQRRYEALRAVFVEGRSQKQVAQQFGYTYGAFRQLVVQFRQAYDQSPQAADEFFFEE